MSQESFSGRVPLRNQFPIVRIFDAAAAAFSPSSIFIATVAAVILNTAVWMCDQALNVQSGSKPPIQTLTVTLPGLESVSPGELIGISLGGPWSSITRSVISMLLPNSTLVQQLNGLLRFFVSLGLWSIVGLILCRRSAFLFTGDDRSTVQRAVDYGIRRWGKSFLSPLIPLLAAIVIGTIAAGFGLVGYLPTGGSLWLLLISPIATVLGFAMAFLLIATLIAWPLMAAAIATDDCDSFGALSRTYSMLTGRPWLVALYTAVAFAAGVLTMGFVVFLGELAIWCGVSATAIGSGYEAAERSLVRPVTRIVHEIVGGIGTAYFWSAATAVYLLLRHEVDAVPYDRVAPDDDARPIHDPLPVVGIPATDVKIDESSQAPIEIRDVK